MFLTAKGITKPDGSGILTTGAVVTSWFHYGAFGEIIAQGGESTHRRQANGKEADAASGLRYYGARYYDPLLMKWTSADPLYRFAPDFSPLEPQRSNLYAFTANNPVRLIDPDGHSPYDSLVIADRIQRTPNAISEVGQAAGMAVSQWVLDNVIVGQLMKETYDRSQKHGAVGAAAYATISIVILLLPGPKESPRPGMEAPRMGLEPSFNPEIGPRVELPPASPSATGSAKAEVAPAANGSGSYTNTHESGMVYHGKGGRERSQASGERIAAEHDDPHIATDWTPAANDREAFKQESLRIEKDGGVKSPMNYNIAESPGKRYREEDSIPAMEASGKDY